MNEGSRAGKVTARPNVGREGWSESGRRHSEQASSDRQETRKRGLHTIGNLGGRAGGLVCMREGFKAGRLKATLRESGASDTQNKA